MRPSAPEPPCAIVCADQQLKITSRRRRQRSPLRARSSVRVATAGVAATTSERSAGTLVCGAVFRHEIPLLELNRQDDVRGRGHRKHEMRQRHRRRHPEREQEAEVQRMPHEAVGQRRAEGHGVYGRPISGSHDLPQAEQIEVVDQERHHRARSPIRRQTASTARRAPAAFSTDQIWIPIGRHCQNSSSSARLAHSTYVERSMRPGNDLRPSLLEPSPRHHAVLNGEDRQERAVDRQRRRQRRLAAGHRGASARRSRRRRRSHRETWRGRSDTTRHRRQRTADVWSRHSLLLFRENAPGDAPTTIGALSRFELTLRRPDVRQMSRSAR